MMRAELTEKIMMRKIHSGIKWSDIAEKVGQSKEWTTAALMGQISMTKEEATAAGGVLNLSEDDITLLQVVPYRGSVTEDVPKDPLIYRLYEVVHVYGTTIKALIEEEFGDGIMSAIDFTMDIERKNDPNGDRVILTLDGKFLSYKKY